MQKNIDPTSGCSEQVLRLFLAVDIAGSSSYKYRTSAATINGEQEPWHQTFCHVFSSIYNSIRQEINRFRNNFHFSYFTVKLWRITGDEVVFFIDLPSHMAAYWSMLAFIPIVRQYDHNCSERYGVGIKGFAWTAGFPIRNRRIQLSNVSSNAQITSIDDEESPKFFSGLKSSVHIYTDFMGPEMDQGFRLGTHSVPGRILVSPDAAFITAKGRFEADRFDLLQSNSEREDRQSSIPPMRFVHVGWSALNGVLGEEPVPILWAEDIEASDEKIFRRRVFDHVTNSHEAAYRNIKARINDGLEGILDYEELIIFFRHLHSSFVRSGVSHVIPYVSYSDMDEDHAEAWRLGAEWMMDLTEMGG
ncbi:MAG: hypothetical protein AAFX54_17650 [Pseudomonadota bacterium]